MRKVKKLRRKFRGFIQIIPEHIVESFINIGCGAGRKSIVINPKGEVRPCIMLPSTYLYMGNIFRDSLENIMLIFNDLHLTFPNKDVCKKCSHLAFCLGCIARGIKMWESLKDECTWGCKMNLRAKIFGDSNG